MLKEERDDKMELEFYQKGFDFIGLGIQGFLIPLYSANKRDHVNDVL